MAAVHGSWVLVVLLLLCAPGHTLCGKLSSEPPPKLSSEPPPAVLDVVHPAVVDVVHPPVVQQEGIGSGLLKAAGKLVRLVRGEQPNCTTVATVATVAPVGHVTNRAATNGSGGMVSKVVLNAKRKTPYRGHQVQQIGEMSEMQKQRLGYFQSIKPQIKHMMTNEPRNRKVRNARIAKEDALNMLSQTAAEKKNNAGTGASSTKWDCAECKKSFHSFGALEVHVRTHTGERPFNCSKCGRKFSDRSNFKKHIGPNGPHHEHRCKICKKKLASDITLKYHIMLHLNNGKYACDVCPKRLPTPQMLQKHRRKHTGARPYACRFCNVTMADSSNLQKHIRLHTKVRPYRCQICNESFSDMSNLMQRHLPTHVGHEKMRRYPCKICGKSFTQKAALRGHMGKHEGVKLSRCPSCGMYTKRPKHIYGNKCPWCIVPDQGLNSNGSLVV